MTLFLQVLAKMNLSNSVLNLYIIFEIIILVKCEHNLNHFNSDDMEKRRSVKQFFDSLVAGSNQNTKTSSQTPNNPTPRPDGPIYMPFAVPVHAHPPPPPGPHVHIAPPPSFGFASNINNIYRPPPPSSRPHIHLPPFGQSYGSSHSPHHHNSHSHNHHNYGLVSPINQNYGIQSHPYHIPHSPHSAYHNHYDFGQHSRPIAIAIPLPLHALP